MGGCFQRSPTLPEANLWFALRLQDCYSPTDFRMGAYINVLGRDFLIHDADTFTKVSGGARQLGVVLVQGVQGGVKCLLL